MLQFLQTQEIGQSSEKTQNDKKRCGRNWMKFGELGWTREAMTAKPRASRRQASRKELQESKLPLRRRLLKMREKGCFTPAADPRTLKLEIHF